MARAPLNALQDFVAVARVQNLTRAAERQHITVSALSHQMRTLEQRVGCPLFVRGSRGLTLTAEGRMLLDNVAPHIEAIEHALRPLCGRRSNVLNLSAMPSMGSSWLLPRLPRFVKRHPEAKLMVAWHNHWPQSMGEIGTVGHVRGMPAVDRTGRTDMARWLEQNGIPADNVIDLGLRGNVEMASLLAEADVALFTNRAEGGTNLVAMEALALGVPTILSANTGHLDLVDDSRCFVLRRQSAVRATASFRGVDGWGETSVDEAIEALEMVYANPDEAARRAANAAAWMRGLSWDSQIDKLYASIDDLI